MARDNNFVVRHDIPFPPLTDEEAAQVGLVRRVEVTFKVAEGGVLLIKAVDPDDMGEEVYMPRVRVRVRLRVRLRLRLRVRVREKRYIRLGLWVLLP